jgi:DnaD/phage-associated family protein
MLNIKEKKPKVEKYSPDRIIAARQNYKVKDMFEYIKKLYGREPSTNEMFTYLDWIEDYNMPPELIILLIEDCFSRGKKDLPYLKQVAKNWFDAGVTSLDKANEYTDTKSRSEKARHKWTKEISQIKFTAKSKGGEGIAIWRTRNELVLLSGAKLVNDPQLNKDGTKNFSAQLAEKVRSDHSDKIVDNVTTEDIVFPSPNILGIFLFFGGQNTWIELKDENGKSLDEWSRID